MTRARDLTFYNKTERPWLNRMDRSSLVGHTTAHGAKLWVRMKQAGDYLLVMSAEPLKGRLFSPAVPTGGRWFVPDDLGGDKIALVGAVPFRVDGSSDFTHVIDTHRAEGIPELRPDSRYYYAVYSYSPARWELGVENHHGFRTLPEDDGRPWDISFGLYSCHMPYDKRHGSKADASMWGIMREELSYANARFVIGGGDQVYADGTPYLDIWAYLNKVKQYRPEPEDMKSWYRDIYRGYWGFPDVQAVHRGFPNYMIWDDHEIMDGWGSYTRKELSNQLDSLLEREDREQNLALAGQMFDAAAHCYREYQHSHNPDTPAGQYDFTVASCGADYFYLDMRGRRDFEREQNAILGEQQHRRLLRWADELSAERAGPIFVVSPVPMVHLKDFVANTLDWLSIFGARDDVRDHWAHEHHNAEFKRILTLLFATSQRTGRPLVVLSGDVHLGCVFELFSERASYPRARVYQVTSSAITYAPLGAMKLALLSRGVAHHGRIGAYKARNGRVVDSGFGFRNHLIFPQFNFALIRYQTDGRATTGLQVDFIGRSDDERVKESRRVDLLRLGR